MPQPKTRTWRCTAAAAVLSSLAGAASAGAQSADPVKTVEHAPPLYAHNEQGNLRPSPRPEVAIATPPPPPQPCPADRNGDGAITSADLSRFITDWQIDLSAGTLGTDVNADGAVTSADVSAFLTIWLATRIDGCG